jgi:hypothetical protein
MISATAPRLDAGVVRELVEMDEESTSPTRTATGRFGAAPATANLAAATNSSVER